MLAAAIVAAGLAASPAVEAARAHVDRRGPAILREYAELLAIPNVATDTANIRRNAEWIAAALQRRGVRAELLSVDGAPPLILGVLDVPGAARTIGLYVHYDGQPVDEAAWSTPPWEPALYTGPIDAGGALRALPGPGEPIEPEWRLYGRASADDKAPLMALLAALDALAAADLAPTSNIRLMLEGEEEAGSPHLGEYFDRYGDRLNADVWLVCDGPVHQSRRPQLVFGVRGITSMQITVYGADRYLHSGHYGNWAPNPALMLAELLASMKNDRGLVVVDGFYDGVAPPTEAERAAAASVPDVEDALRRELGIAEPESGLSLLGSLMLPSLNVQGLAGGAVGEKARNVIPNTATAAIDIRLVPGNDPQRMLELVEAHIREQGFHIVREAPDRATRLEHPRIARVTRGGGYRAVRTPMDHPLVGPLQRAAEHASGEPAVMMPSLGGSLPLYLFEEKLDAPTIIVPIANHDNNQHGPDENIRLANLLYGIDLMAGILTLEEP